MLSNLIFTLNAVMPIILIILAGYFLKSIKLFERSFFPLLNKLCFRCLLPCLLFYNVYNVDNIREISHYGRICLFAVISVLIFFTLSLIVVILTVKKPEQKGVMTQCTFRSNYAIIGISLAMSISDNDPTTLVIASIISSISIPLFNVLAIISLSIFIRDEGRKFSIRSILKKIATNPLIIGVAAGFLFLLIRLLIPVNDQGIKLFTIKTHLPFIYKTISMLALSASPVALIALGGNFEFSAVAKLKKQIIAGVLVRTVICPLTCLTAAYMAGFSGQEFPSLIALYGTPVAVSSVPMAAEMKNDAELAGQLVVWTTISSAFTLFAIIFICAQSGIL